MTAAPGSRSTIIELHRSAVAQLKRSRLVYGHGTHNPRDEAACLLAHAVGLPPAELSGHSAQVVTSLQQRRFDRLVARRVKERIPAPYLTRQAWLGDFSFYVDRRVIVPRSFIAELLRDGLDIWMKDPVRRVLDLCTGSGCLAILAAHAFPRARVDATDVSLGALAVARRNVLQYRLSRRVCLVNSNLFEALAGRRYDLILNNPPYVTAASMRALPRSIATNRGWRSPEVPMDLHWSDASSPVQGTTSRQELWFARSATTGACLKGVPSPAVRLARSERRSGPRFHPSASAHHKRIG